MTETVKKSKDFRLEADRFQLSEHARNHWVITVEKGTSVENLLDPAYWANVAAKLRPWDLIEARWDDGSRLTFFVVLGAERTYAKVAVWLDQPLTTKEVAESQDSGVTGYKYVWKGAKLKHCIVRQSDGEVVHKEAHTKADALFWLREHEDQLTA